MARHRWQHLGASSSLQVLPLFPPNRPAPTPPTFLACVSDASTASSPACLRAAAAASASAFCASLLSFATSLLTCVQVGCGGAVGFEVLPLEGW